MDDAHEEIAHVGTVWCLVEQGVLAVQDDLLQGTLSDVMPGAELCRVASRFVRATKAAVFSDAA